MRKFFFCLFLITALFSCGRHDIFRNDEARIAVALQEALFLGSQTAAIKLGDSSCEINVANKEGCVTGYLGNKLVEILLPDTVERVLTSISKITVALKPYTSYLPTLPDLSHYGDSIKVALNRGAEQAAPASIGVFKEAIFGLSFSDAKGILLGSSNEATSYLHTTTYSGLQSAFAPIIREPLELLKPDKYWGFIASGYNALAAAHLQVSSIGFSLEPLPYDHLPTNISEYLSNYATEWALDGLFKMVGQQEEKLREDPLKAVREAGSLITDDVGDLLNDVFGKAKHGLY
ncbi:MAG: DUF4197 domain-containing protein [Fibromonadaceae bacterium]|jgi:hypothetical protein|nr:DUF4197 domain-containing protein [Fibromonadaceae bacterium]